MAIEVRVKPIRNFIGSVSNVVIFSLLTALGLIGTVGAEEPAGTVLYFRAGDAVYFLLADHRHEGAKTRGWAGFSGGGNKGESRAETAARQTEEETRGYYSREVLLRKIESVEPIHDGGFTFYFVEVDFVPAVRVANHQKGTKEEDLLERGPYAWIPWTEIKKYLGSDIDRRRTYPIDRRYLPEGRNTHWFWPLWLGNLRRAVETGALPWED